MSRAQRFGHAESSTRRIVSEVAAVSAVTGIAMGVVWWLLAPDVVGVVVDGQLLTDGEEGRKLFSRDAVFALLAAACGLLVAAACMFRHRRRPVTVLLAVAVAGLAGSLLAELTGMLLASGAAGSVADLPDGTEHSVALQLGSSQGMVVWPLVATVVAGLVALFREDTTPWVARLPES